MIRCHSLVASTLFRIGVLPNPDSDVIVELLKRLGQSLNPYCKNDHEVAPVGLVEATQWSRLLSSLLVSEDEPWAGLLQSSLTMAIGLVASTVDRCAAFNFISGEADPEVLESVKSFVRSDDVNVSIGLLNICGTQGQHEGLPGSPVLFNSSGSMAERNIVLGFAADGAAEEFKMVAEECSVDGVFTTQRALTKALQPRHKKTLSLAALKAAILSEANQFTLLLTKLATLRVALEGGGTSVLLTPAEVISSLLREMGIDALTLLYTVSSSTASLWPLLLREFVSPSFKDGLPLSSVPTSPPRLAMTVLKIFKDQPNMHILEILSLDYYKVVYAPGASLRCGFELWSNSVATIAKDVVFAVVETKINRQGLTRVRHLNGEGWATVVSVDGFLVLERVEGPASEGAEIVSDQSDVNLLLMSINGLFDTVASSSIGGSQQVQAPVSESSWVVISTTGADNTALLETFIASLSSASSAEQRFVVAGSSAIAPVASAIVQPTATSLSPLQKGILSTPTIIAPNPEIVLRDIFQQSSVAKLYHLLCDILSSWPAERPLLAAGDVRIDAIAGIEANLGDLYLLLKAAGLDSIQFRTDGSPLLKALQHATKATTQGQTSSLTSSLATIACTLFQCIFVPGQDPQQLKGLLCAGTQKAVQSLEEIVTGFDTALGSAVGYRFNGSIAVSPSGPK